MAGLVRGLVHLLWPPVCAVCAEDVASELVCTRCATRLVRTPSLPPPPPPLAEWYAATRFEGDVALWVHRFKYPGRGLAALDPAADAVARELALRVARKVPDPLPNAVVPVPLHPKRLRTRGFNPAGRVARHVARERGARFSPRALERIRDTRSQTGLDRAARRSNVDGAFRARVLLPRRVWLVDDVATTGATLAAAAAAARAGGALEIVALALAFTPKTPERERGEARADRFENGDGSG